MSVNVESVPNYRRASERWPNAPTLAEYYTAISAAGGGNNHGLVEHVKSFIECLCVTILTEFGLPLPSSDPSMTELLVAALKPLGLQNTRGASKLDKVLSGFNKLSDALSEMRNETGPVAHGKDAFLDALCSDHARAFLHTGDAIVGVLLNALEGKEPNFLHTREPYERFKHLCDRIDRTVGIEASIDQDGAGPILVISMTVLGKEEALELRIEPSRLLYGIDRTAFIEVLNDAPEKVPEPEEAFESEEEQEWEPNEPQVEREDSPLVQSSEEYAGALAGLRPGLEGFLASEGLVPTNGGELVSSILASAEENMGIDWQKRDSLQARLKVAFRRLLVRSGIDSAKATDGAERLLAWLRIQAPANIQPSEGSIDVQSK